MGRWTQYDEDEYRIGHRKIGYDADTGEYFYSGGWKSLPNEPYKLVPGSRAPETWDPSDSTTAAKNISYAPSGRHPDRPPSPRPKEHNKPSPARRMMSEATRKVTKIQGVLNAFFAEKQNDDSVSNPRPSMSPATVHYKPFSIRRRSDWNAGAPSGPDGKQEEAKEKKKGKEDTPSPQRTLSRKTGMTHLRSDSVPTTTPPPSSRPSAAHIFKNLKDDTALLLTRSATTAGQARTKATTVKQSEPEGVTVSRSATLPIASKFMGLSVQEREKEKVRDVDKAKEKDRVKEKNKDKHREKDREKDKGGRERERVTTLPLEAPPIASSTSGAHRSQTLVDRSSQTITKDNEKDKVSRSHSMSSADKASTSRKHSSSSSHHHPHSHHHHHHQHSGHSRSRSEGKERNEGNEKTSKSTRGHSSHSRAHTIATDDLKQSRPVTGEKEAQGRALAEILASPKFSESTHGHGHRHGQHKNSK